MAAARVAGRERKENTMAQKANSLAHTKWMCKHRVVFCPKHGRGAIHDQYREDLGQIPGQPCQWRGVEAIEGHLMPGHARMLAGIPPKTGVPGFMGYPRGKSSLLMFDRHANLKYKFGNRKFWAEGYYVSTVGPSEATIAKYIREQEQADIALDRPGVKEYGDPSEK
jgi:putative transposase